jgi:hypothetical protein
LLLRLLREIFQTHAEIEWEPSFSWKCFFRHQFICWLEIMTLIPPYVVSRLTTAT